MIAVSQIVQFVRRGRVFSLATFGDEETEVLELMLTNDSELVNKPLKELKLPRGVLVGAIGQNDQVQIPDCNSVIRDGDHVVFFVEKRAQPKLEKLLVGSERI